MKLMNLAGCSELVHAEWILPDLTLSWITFPFRWLLSLSLSPPPYPFKSIHIHTQPPPTPCWGSKWSKITHSATQSLLHLALGTDCFISWLFSPLSLLCSLLFLIGPVIGPVFFFLFPYHRNSTKTRARDVELLDLSHCVVCVDLVRPHTSGMCFFILDAFVGKESNVLRSPQAVALAPARVSCSLLQQRCKKTKQNRVSPCSVKADTALTRQKGFL